MKAIDEEGASNKRKRLYQPQVCKHDMFSKASIVEEQGEYPKDIEPGTCFRKVFFQGSQNLNMYKKPSETTCSAIRSWQNDYMQRLGLGNLKSNGKVLWVARKHSREIINRNEVIKELQSQGVPIEEIRLEDLSLEDQIRSIAEADIVVGPHGAGLGKVAFMRPGSVLIEIMPFGIGSEAPDLWVFPDGTTFRKGENFTNFGKCLGVDYTIVDTPINQMEDREKPEHYEDPHKHWGKPVDLYEGIHNGAFKNQVVANQTYVGDAKTKFKVKKMDIVHLIKSKYKALSK